MVFDSGRFCLVVKLGACAVGVDVIDLVGAQTGIAERVLH
jgi:hypothetical protein